MKKLFLALLLVFGPPALADVATSAADGAPPTVIVLGDSLSAGYGLAVEETWVSLLATRLAQEGYGHRVVNASVSGDTTSGGLARLGPVLERHDPELVIIELGGNDGLRGIRFAEMRANLRRIVQAVREAGARALLVGVHMPGNYGAEYDRRFRAVYRDLAEEMDVPLVAGFLEGVTDDPALLQEDLLHPNAQAQPLLLGNLLPALLPLLEPAASPSAAAPGPAPAGR